MNKQVGSQLKGDMNPNLNAHEAATNQETNQQFGRGYECKFKCPPTTRWNTVSHCFHCFLDAMTVEWNGCKNKVYNLCYQTFAWGKCDNNLQFYCSSI